MQGYYIWYLIFFMRNQQSIQFPQDIQIKWSLWRLIILPKYFPSDLAFISKSITACCRSRLPTRTMKYCTSPSLEMPRAVPVSCLEGHSTSCEREAADLRPALSGGSRTYRYYIWVVCWIWTGRLRFKSPFCRDIHWMALRQSLTHRLIYGKILCHWGFFC